MSWSSLLHTHTYTQTQSNAVQFATLNKGLLDIAGTCTLSTCCHMAHKAVNMFHIDARMQSYLWLQTIFLYRPKTVKLRNFTRFEVENTKGTSRTFSLHLNRHVMRVMHNKIQLICIPYSIEISHLLIIFLWIFKTTIRITHLGVTKQWTKHSLITEWEPLSAAHAVLNPLRTLFFLMMRHKHLRRFKTAKHLPHLTEKVWAWTFKK